jgi:hypothetical protein
MWIIFASFYLRLFSLVGLIFVIYNILYYYYCPALWRHDDVISHPAEYRSIITVNRRRILVITMLFPYQWSRWRHHFPLISAIVISFIGAHDNLSSYLSFVKFLSCLCVCGNTYDVVVKLFCRPPLPPFQQNYLSLSNCNKFYINILYCL